MRSLSVLSLLCLLILLGSCENSPVQPPGPSGGVTPDSDDELLLGRVELQSGSVEVRARNLQWDGEEGIASFDVYLVNRSNEPLLAPVDLVVVSFDPSEVVLSNAQGSTDDGLPYRIFDDEFGSDGVLVPGDASETSLFVFGVGSVRAFAMEFALDAHDRGYISGLVFQDDNGDGVMQEGEVGLPGIRVNLGWIENGQDETRTMETSESGFYRFSGLDANVYGVVVELPDGAVATTATERTVALLVTEDETVAGYAHSHFGLQMEAHGPPCENGEAVVFRVEVQDDFAGPPVMGDPSDEVVGLIEEYWTPLYVTGFDDQTPNAAFAHTFTGLPSDICSAVLTVRLRALAGGSDNDKLRLELYSQEPLIQGDWAWWPLINWYSSQYWAWGATETFVLDLSNLPYNQMNILDALADGDLDVVVEDDTAVDFLVLEICTGCGTGP